MLATETQVLTDTELRQLGRWKWRYTLVSWGFSREQAARLLFARYLVSPGKLSEVPSGVK